MENIQEKLKQKFYYENGVLYRKYKNKLVEAGTKKPNNRVEVYFNSKIHGVHRLIFAYHYGYLPECVDHIDNNCTNNNIENLRACTKTENRRNSKTPKHSKTGYKGVVYRNINSDSAKRYNARISVNNVRYCLGFYHTAIEAAEAYNKKALELHGEFARLNVII